MVPFRFLKSKSRILYLKIHDSNSGTFLSMIQFYICHDSRDFLKTAIENCIKTAGLYKSKNTITGRVTAFGC